MPQDHRPDRPQEFRLWYDPGNIFYYSDGKLDPVDDAASVNGAVVGMSVKDFRPPKDVALTPGTGKVDFLRVLARLQQGGFINGPLVVECLDPGDLAASTPKLVKARQVPRNPHRSESVIGFKVKPPMKKKGRQRAAPTETPFIQLRQTA